MRISKHLVTFTIINVIFACLNGSTATAVCQSFSLGQTMGTSIDGSPGSTYEWVEKPKFTGFFNVDGPRATFRGSVSYAVRLNNPAATKDVVNLTFTSSNLNASDYASGKNYNGTINWSGTMNGAAISGVTDSVFKSKAPFASYEDLQFSMPPKMPTRTGATVKIDPAGSCPAITIIGDFNGDCKVEGMDLSILSAEFNKTGPNLKSDINKDGKVDGLDFSIFSSNWGKTCS